MAKWGYTMMTEQASPDQLVRDVRAAEEAGFDFSVSSDHYQPWLESQGHSGYAWSILGAVEKIKPFIDAGFDEVALVQIGGDQQQPFFEWAEKELLPALREL